MKLQDKTGKNLINEKRHWSHHDHFFIVLQEICDSKSSDVIIGMFCFKIINVSHNTSDTVLRDHDCLYISYNIYFTFCFILSQSSYF